MAKQPAIGVLDLGASGGRVFAAVRTACGLSLEPIWAFAHHAQYTWHQPLAGGQPVRRHIWDLGRLYAGMLEGLAALARRTDLELVSFGIDTWGSDGVWLDKYGDPLGLVATGRDARWGATATEIAEHLSPWELFSLTGVRSDPFCALNLVYWYTHHRPQLVAAASTFMPLSSLLHYFLCGERVAEYTWISTAQLLQPGDFAYADEVFTRLGLPLAKMPPLVHPGTVLGQCHAPLATDLNLPRFQVIMPATHDTACAYAAAPIQAGHKAILISSGTWALLGVPVAAPVKHEAAFAARLSNIGGCNEVYHQAISMGSWPAQELRRRWSNADHKELTWAEFTQLAQAAKHADAVVDVDTEILRAPANIEEAVTQCLEQLQSTLKPERTTLARAVTMGAAVNMALACRALQASADYRADEIVMLGGGTANELVNQWLADATGLPVRMGPRQATAMGNALVQALALGWIGSLAEGRQLLADGQPVRCFVPRPNPPVAAACERISAWRRQ